jgi:hypothetical protein
MATILQRLTRALSPTVIRETAKTAGLELELASLGIRVAGPVVVLALADKAALRDGPGTVFQMLPSAGSPMRGELAFVARAGVPRAVLAPVLGARASAVGDRLDRALGFCASSLLPIATAVVLGLTARIVEEQGLDAGGLAELLALEATELRTATGAVARLACESFEPPAPSRVTPVMEGRSTVDELTRFRNSRTRADALTAVREALETISHMSPWEAPRFRRLVADVASCVATASRANGEPRGR